MKTIISESQKILLNELAWLESVSDHIRNGVIPITPKIYNILYGKITLTTFHISDVKNINNIKNIIGTKKTISSFRFMAEDILKNIQGIQTIGGIIYEINGTLSLYGTTDLGSGPDENGIRWVSSSGLFPNRLRDEWRSIAVRLEIALNKISGDPSMRKQKTEIIKKYFISAQNFVHEHRVDVYNHLLRWMSEISGWDEILVSNIKVNDIFWDSARINRLYASNVRDHISPEGWTTGEYQKKLSEYKNWEKRLEEKLKSIANGNVYNSNSGLTPVEFVKQRGGITSPKDYTLPPNLTSPASREMV